MAIKGLHHNAYRCRDSEETRKFYEDFLGLPLAHTLEIRETKTGRKTETLHTFYEMDDGSYLAFFEAPDMPFTFKKQKDFDLHIALEVDPATLERMFAKGKKAGMETRGVSDHHFIRSIYFRDPNGYVIELTAKVPGLESAMDPKVNGARAKLNAWQKAKRKSAPLKRKLKEGSVGPPEESIMANITRRDLMISAACAAPALLSSRNALAGAAPDFPAKNIQFVIPYAPGGGFDIYVRAVIPVMEKYLPRKVSIVPLNVASGAGSRGVTQAYRARPDGYTMTILNIPGMFILQDVQGSAAFDLARFTWIGAMGEGEKYFISVGANSPLKTFDDLKRLSAQRPVKLSVTGPEGTAYMAAVVGTKLMGLRSQLITGYRGSADYVVAAVRGDADAVVAALPTTFRFRRGNQLRPLASFETRSGIPGLPDATSLGQPELDLIRVERLVAAPPGTPAAAVNILSAALAKALVDPVIVKWAAENDVVMKPKTPQEAIAILNEQRAFYEKWKPTLRPS